MVLLPRARTSAPAPRLSSDGGPARKDSEPLLSSLESADLRSSLQRRPPARAPSTLAFARALLRGGLVIVALLALLALLAGSFGCVKNAREEACRPSDLGRCTIEDVDVDGNSVVGDADIEGSIATAQTSHLLGGVFRNVPVLGILDAASVEYERFDRFVLERDLARIERYYRARGFYEARVRAGRVTRRSDGRVRVEISVEEGAPVKIGRVDLEWKDWNLPRAKDVTKPVAEARDELKIGNRFEEAEYEKTKKLILRAMTDRGFAYATVVGKASVDLVRHEAQIVFTIELGPHCTFGDVTIAGHGELPEAPLRNAVRIKKGDEFSTAELESAEIALAEFGVLGAIDVRPQLSPEGQPRSSVVPVVFEVQPSALRAVKAGVGAEVGSIVEAHLVAGWEDRNFLGGLRRLSIEVRPGLVFYPWTITDLFATEQTNVLGQLKTRLEIKQPIPFDTRTSARLSGEFNLYSPPRGSGTPPTFILGYRTSTGTFGFDRPFFKGRVRGGLFFNIEFNDPFSYNYDPTQDPKKEGDPKNPTRVPEGFKEIFVPSIQTVGSFDMRMNAKDQPDPISPNKGVFIKTDVQLAGRFLYSDAQDIRISPEFRGYVPVSRKVTLAFRWATGLIFAADYPESCEDKLKPGVWDRSCSAKDVQLLGLRGYFSGGVNSNRGYAYRGIGPHQRIDALYLVPGSGYDDTTDPLPLGGLTLWETSAELRFPIAGDLGGVFFLDASDVSLRSLDLRFTRPHLSAGFGLRYATPVGPARLDIGYRVRCAQVIGACTPEEINAKYPEEPIPDDLGGLPLSVSLAIGEAF
jgi:outer membrane protein assembly factor BamA